MRTWIGSMRGRSSSKLLCIDTCWKSRQAWLLKATEFRVSMNCACVMPCLWLFGQPISLALIAHPRGILLKGLVHTEYTLVKQAHVSDSFRRVRK